MAEIIHIDKQMEEWIKKLNNIEDIERIDALENPPSSVPASELIPHLIAKLSDSDSLVRLAAAEVLGEYPSEATKKALRDFCVCETDDLARAYGLSSLGLVGDFEDIEFLLKEAEIKEGGRKCKSLSIL